MRTVARLYDDYADAIAVVRELEAAQLSSSSEISLVANENARGRDKVGDTHTETQERETGPGAAVGGTVGAVVGILTGLGLIAIPGVGPLVAAGWLATTLAGAGVGAAAGGLVGAMVKGGVSHEEAEVYEHGVRQGGTLVAVRADDAEVPRVEQIMRQAPSRDWQAYRDEYVASGWKPSTAA